MEKVSEAPENGPFLRKSVDCVHKVLVNVVLIQAEKQKCQISVASREARVMLT